MNSNKSILCSLLESFLNRDEAYALSFFKDRPALERIVKMIKDTSGDAIHTASRAERSAGLHCIVLGCRLTRIDDFALQICLPLLIAGALSGVVAYGHNSESITKVGGRQHAPTRLTTSAVLSSAQELASHSLVLPLVGDTKNILPWCNGTQLYRCVASPTERPTETGKRVRLSFVSFTICLLCAM